MDTMISDDRYMMDAFDQYQEIEQREAAFYFAVHSAQDACTDHGFYPFLCVLHDLCSEEDRKMMINAVQQLLRSKNEQV
jgi:hypothetical protein